MNKKGKRKKLLDSLAELVSPPSGAPEVCRPENTEVIPAPTQALEPSAAEPSVRQQVTQAVREMRQAKDSELLEVKGLALAKCPQCGAINQLQVNDLTFQKKIRCGNKHCRHPLRTGDQVILCDVSSSMLGFVESKKMRRIDILREHLGRLLTMFDGALLIGFNDREIVVADADHLPEPCGGTNFATGLKRAKDFHPFRVALISDGEPTTCSPAQAYAAAQTLGCPVDTLYCGEDSKHTAKSFLKKIADLTGGRTEVVNFEKASPKQVEFVIRRLLEG